MRTRTIFEAHQAVSHRYYVWLSSGRDKARYQRQLSTFEAELLRRMDHYDWYEARQRFFDAPHNLNGKEQNDMNAAYMRFAAHPREQARVAAWRKANGI